MLTTALAFLLALVAPCADPSTDLPTNRSASPSISPSSGSSAGSSAGPVAERPAPYRAPWQTLRAPAARDVAVDDGFWAPRIRASAERTLPHCFDVAEKTGRIANFLRAAGKLPGDFEGLHFNDSDVYKIVEGADRALALGPDLSLERLADRTVAAIAAAQDRDGYLGTYFTIARRDERFRHIHPDARHELYCIGHAIEAGATRFELHGKRDLLDVAVRLADHVASVFGPGKRGEVPEHQEIEIALVKLWRVTGERRFLDLARFFIEERGNAAGHALYGEYAQDHLPIREQSEVVGHAVRAMYGCCGAADLYAETGDAELFRALRRLWESATHRKMYVTGGVGATAVGEAFGGDYDLPNETAYAETCAQIGLALFAHRMLLLDPDPRHRVEYADVLDRVLHNGFLSGVSLSGDRFFYRNELAGKGTYRRVPWYDCACCPSNVVRLIPRIGELAYAVGDDSIWVHLYVTGTARLEVGGTRVAIRVDTRYPWDGKVRIVVDPEREATFELALRIPEWCRRDRSGGGLYRWDRGPDRPRIEVCGKPLPLDGAPRSVDDDEDDDRAHDDGAAQTVTLKGGYARVRRAWRPGDTVALDLPMPVIRVRAHHRVAAARGRVALQRGPIVYAFEGIDHDGAAGTEGSALDLVVPPEAAIAAEPRPDLLGGVVVLSGKGRKLRPDGSEVETPFLAIPYYARDHRGASDFTVWPLEDPARAGPWRTEGWIGANYTPAWCVNQVQMWHEFRPEVIERELAAAREHLGITALRVFLHNLPFDAERDAFLGRIDAFIGICHRHGIRPGFVFFDDCHRRDGITLESLPPVKGWHNGRWAACPQGREREEADRGDGSDPGRVDDRFREGGSGEGVGRYGVSRFRKYVEDVVRAHAGDPRVLFWEIFNEPDLRDTFSRGLRREAYVWAKALDPIQPVISSWDDHPETDIVDAHAYSADFAAWDRQADLNPAKGCVFTEAGARWDAPRTSSGSPTEVIAWLQGRRAAGKYVPGVFLAWELMVGNSNCRWYWGTPEGAPEPTIPWCGLLWPDGSPVSLSEAEAIRRYATGASRALLHDDFRAAPPASRPGWTAYGPPAAGSSVLDVPAGAKMVAGDASWTDYVLEARVMLLGEGGNAGVVFRANDPGPGADQLRGYYAGLDTRTLYLGRMEDRWIPLGSFDLGKLECRVVPGVWNLIRVAVEGPRIRVWLNRMHPEADGLRLDVTDPGAPIPTGAVGVRAFNVAARFDDFVVLPIDALPGAGPPEGSARAGR